SGVGEQSRPEKPGHSLIEHIIGRHPGAALTGRFGTNSRHTAKSRITIIRQHQPAPRVHEQPPKGHIEYRRYRWTRRGLGRRRPLSESGLTNAWTFGDGCSSSATWCELVPPCWFLPEKRPIGVVRATRPAEKL